MIRASMRSMLKADGYRIVSAANGEQALDLLHHGLRPCLILLGFTMLGMNGMTFRSLLRNPALAAIPVATYANHLTGGAEALAAVRLGRRFDASEVLDLVNRRCAKY